MTEERHVHNHTDGNSSCCDLLNIDISNLQLLHSMSLALTYLQLLHSMSLALTYLQLLHSMSLALTYLQLLHSRSLALSAFTVCSALHLKWRTAYV
jgi:hypothetical protein